MPKEVNLKNGIQYLNRLQRWRLRQQVHKKGAHIRDGVDLKRTMMTVIFAMIPCLLFGIYNTGHWEMVAAAGDRDLAYWADQVLKSWLDLRLFCH